MIELKNVNKIYTTKKSETKALIDINLTLPNKGMVFILGKSGCGKSTLLNLLGGLDKPTSGDIIFNNKNISLLNNEQYDSYRNNEVGFIFQEYNLIDNLTVIENIKIALTLQNKEINEDDIISFLKKFDIDSIAYNKCNTLSGGQKQRVAIARALIKNPHLILADEPTGAVDKDNSEQIMTILKNLSKDKLIVIVTHDLELANKYADNIIKIEDGKIISNSIKNIENEVVKNNEEKNRRLPFSYTFKFGLRNIFRKPTRLILSILLIIISLTSFGAFTTLLNYDDKECLESVLNNATDYSYLNLYSEYQGKLQTFDEDKIIKEEKIIKSAQFSLDDFNKAKEINPNIIASYNVSEYTSLRIKAIELNNIKRNVYTDRIKNIIHSDSNLNYLIGNKPNNENEIAISSFLFDTLKYCSNEYKLNTYEDIINNNLTINYNFNEYNFNIVGVYESEKIPQKYEQFVNDVNNMNFWDEDYDNREWVYLRDNGFYNNVCLNSDGFKLMKDIFFIDQFNENKDQNKFVTSSNSYQLFNNDKLVNKYTYASLGTTKFKDGFVDPKLLDNKGNLIENDQSINNIYVSANDYLLLVRNTIIDKLKNEGSNFISYDEFLQFDLDYINELDLPLKTIENYKKLVNIIDNLNIQLPKVTIKDMVGQSLIVNLGGAYFGEAQNGCMMSDDLFTKIYRGDNPYTKKIFKTNYVRNEDDIFTNLYIVRNKENNKNVVKLLNKINNDDSFLNLSNEDYDDVKQLSFALNWFFKAFLIAGSICLLFAILLLYLFISSVSESNAKEIGVLRALGTSYKDIFSIYFTSSTLISLVCAILCCIFTGVISFVINNMITNQYAINGMIATRFTFVSVFIILLVALFTSFISTLLSIRKYKKEMPANSLRVL